MHLQYLEQMKSTGGYTSCQLKPSTSPRLKSKSLSTVKKVRAQSAKTGKVVFLAPRVHVGRWDILGNFRTYHTMTLEPVYIVLGPFRNNSELCPHWENVLSFRKALRCLLAR